MLRRQPPRRGLQFLGQREKFLPIKLAVMQERMLQDRRLSDRERTQLRRLFEMIAARFHMEFRQRNEYLKRVYEPFDPDCDTVALKSIAKEAERLCPIEGDGKGLAIADTNSLGDCSPTSTSQNASDGANGATTDIAELESSFSRLLIDANYTEMPREQILACAEYQVRRDIVVKASLADYAELRVFYRGVRREVRTRRDWHAPWRTLSATQHILARVAVFVRLAKQSDSVFLKLFKDVVAEDLEMLLPYVRIRMKLLDQLKIGSSVAGGVVAASWKAWTAAALSPWLALIVGTGFAGACFRGVTGFFSSKARYIHALTANLYFQNLANNGSMLAHVIDAAEAEQCKELLLPYFLLYVDRARDFTQEQLDRRAEDWLAKEFDVRVDFDVSDAVQKLVDKRLVVMRNSPDASPERIRLEHNGLERSELKQNETVLKVFDLPSSLRRLDEAWDNRFEEEETPADDRLADAHWPPSIGVAEVVRLRKG